MPRISAISWSDTVFELLSTGCARHPAFRGYAGFWSQNVMMDESSDVAGVIAPPPILFAAGLAVGLLADRFVSLPKPPKLAARVIGAGLFVSAAAYGPPAALQMRAMKTNIDPYHPTTVIVESGPFGLSRNPLYVSMAMLYAAIALLARATLPLALLPVVLAAVHRGVIAREERYLERKFGGAYLEYKRRVRRWL